MDDGSPTLEVGFAIDTGGSFEALVQLQNAMSSTEGKLVADAAKIEKATGGMLSLGGATASMTSFGAAATREAQNSARELGKIEKAGEALSRQLDRQTASFGKTREEMRGMKVEAAALAAEQQGLTELADRLRSQEGALYAEEFAAARRIRFEVEATAEAKQGAASAAVAAAEREATAVHQAAQAYQMFEARARAGAAAMREVDSAVAADAREVARLRAALDPAGTAAAATAAQLAKYRDMAARGVITAEELAGAERLAGDAAKGHGAALGFNRTQFMIAEGAAHRYFDSLAAGMSPGRAFMMQAGDIGNILAMDSGGVAGGLSKVAGLINPVTVGIAAVTAVVATGAGAWLSYANAVDKAQALSIGAGRVIGLSAGDIDAQAAAAGRLATIGAGAARQTIEAFVEMGGIGKDVLGGLTALSVNFAAATGEDSKTAVEELGRAFQDPVKGAEDLTQRYGVLTQAQVEHIKTLIEQNDLYGAQAALLAGLGPQFDSAAEHANILARAGHTIAAAFSDAWNWIGKVIDRAVTGGTIANKIGDLTKGRDRFQALTLGMGNTSYYDRQIVALQKQLQQQNAQNGFAEARSRAAGAMKIVDSATGGDEIGPLRQKLGALNGLLADNGKAAGLSADQLTRAKQAQDMYTHAVNSYLPEGEKQVRLAQLDAQIAVAKKGHDQARVASLATQRSEIENSGKLITAAQSEAQAVANGTKAKIDAVGAGDKHAQQLVREAAALEAQVRNTYALADAYGVSGAAALLAEARVKAESQAIKARSDVQAEVDRQVRLSIAQRVADAAKGTAAMRDQAMIQEQVNAEVAAGNVTAARAAELVRDRMADLSLLNASQAANQLAAEAAKAKDVARASELAVAANRATDALDDQRAARDRLTDSETKASLQTALAGGQDQLAELREELRLVGANDAARVHALAALKATQELQEKGQGGPLAAKFIAQQIAIADTQQALTEKTAQFGEGLREAAQRSEELGDILARSFGRAGAAIGDAVKILGSYGEKQAEIDAQVKAGTKTRQEGITASADLQMNSLIGLADAAKGLFKAHSAGYKAMEAAEKALTIVQVARTAVAVAEGAANMFATAGPAGFGLVAAMLAVMASVGFKGGGHSGSAPKTDDGTGTVLGDSTAKSESIKRSIDQLKGIDDVTLTVTRNMLDTLRSIDSNIGGLASLLVRSGAIDANTAGVNEGFKSSLSSSAAGALIAGPVGAILGKTIGKIPVIGDIFNGVTGVLKSLFGTKTKILASGISADPQALSEILAGGFTAETYADIKKTKKFFGVSSGSKTKTKYGDLDDDIEQQFGLILKGFGDAITAAGGPLGLATSDITKRLDSFVVNIGKIDLKGLSGTEIEDKLSAVFGAAGDDMAKAAVPGLEEFQKVGEGYLETLVRVASTVEQVDATFRLLGRTSSGMGMKVDMAIAGMFDSVSDFVSASSSYFTTYYSKEEQVAARTAQMARAFGDLGLAMPSSLAGFRQLVEAQNLNTTAGQRAYATLLQLAPAFADLQSSMNGAKSAADILSERQDLQRQLLELQGNTAAIRALDLANVDVSNKALQEQVWAIQDAQDAAKAAADLRDAWKSVGDSIEDEVKRIRGLTDGAASGGFAALQGQFNAATFAARGGDQDAAKALPQLSQALLTAASEAATSQQELARVQALTAASLDQTHSMIAGLAGGASTTDIVSAASAAASASSAPSASANDNLVDEVRALRGELAQLRSDNNAGHAATAGNTGGIKRTLENVTSQSGGDAIATVAAA